jgi:anti-sigma factor RsiW
VNCGEGARWIDAEVDGELDGLRAHALRRHLQGCADCRARSVQLHEQRARAALELPYHRAPEGLRARVAEQLAVLAPPPPTVAPERPRWPGFWRGAMAGALATAAVWVASVAWQTIEAPEQLAARLVGLHTQAALSAQRIQVASSDQHVVKPWLSARLDYAVPVQDLAAAGFPLAGARIDNLDGRPIAVLVYHHREHVIDVFVRPASPSAHASSFKPVRGFQLAEAMAAQMQWIAVSDLNGKELAAFVNGLANGSLAPAGS